MSRLAPGAPGGQVTVVLCGTSAPATTLQPLVARDCAEQVVNANRSIIGLMLESNLEAGNLAAGLRDHRIVGTVGGADFDGLS